MTTTTERVPAALSTRAAPVPLYLQRCGGVQCPPGTCDHDGTETIQRAPSHHFGQLRLHPGSLDGRIQPALELGPVGDRYEQEAERIADLVASGPGTASQSRSAANSSDLPRPALLPGM